AVAIARQPAADSVGADPGEAQTRAAATAAGAAQRLEPHSAVAARLADLRTGEMAHGVARPLLQRDAEYVARALSHPERLEEAGIGDDGPLVASALGAAIAARRSLAARLALLTAVPRHRLAGGLPPLRFRGLLRQGHRAPAPPRRPPHQRPPAAHR